jgi:hypothetical protein
MDLVYLALGAGCWWLVVGMARGCARLQVQRGRS